MSLSILIRIVVWMLVLWALWRMLGKLLSGSKKSGVEQDPTSVPNNMVKDPVCGMYMDSRLALRLENRKEAFYFCSEECRNKYLGNSKAGETRDARSL